MKKFLICLLSTICTLFSMIGLVGCDNNKLTAEQIYESIAPSVVTITSISSNGISQGSGFFINDDSTVVTNYHVIENANTAIITLNNKKKYSVEKIIGFDQSRDIAILKTSPTQASPLKISSSQIKTGEKVYSIGTASGLSGSLSEGIISTAEREISGQSYIQTTVSVTHGNSGCPLINEYGNVIGIVSGGIGEGALELNFAIPITAINHISTNNILTQINFNPIPTLNEGILTVGVCADWEPYEYLENGKFKGIEIEKITLIANYWDLQVVFVNMQYENLWEAVTNSSVDCTIGQAYTDFRGQSANFSYPLSVFPKTLDNEEWFTVVYTHINAKILANAINCAMLYLEETGDFALIEQKYN